MKYALFVLGMILIVVGGYFLFSGSNIIEVERGWASVISGTTALTGGIITLGLAGVVKSLEDLQRLWADGVERPVIGATRQETPVPPVVAVETLTPDFSPKPSKAEAISPFEASPFEAEIAADEPPLPPAPEVLPNPLPNPQPSPLKERPRLAPQFERSEDKATPSAAIAALRQRAARPQPASEPPAPPELEPAEVTPPPLHLDDLEIDEPELPIHHPEPETHEPAPEVEAAPAVAPEWAAAEAEEQPDPDAPKPKAIGRYEADGTLYVMFADGSIEAQSADGTRHFKSMEELKASFHA